MQRISGKFSFAKIHPKTNEYREKWGEKHAQSDFNVQLFFVHCQREFMRKKRDEKKRKMRKHCWTLRRNTNEQNNKTGRKINLYLFCVWKKRRRLKNKLFFSRKKSNDISNSLYWQSSFLVGVHWNSVDQASSGIKLSKWQTIVERLKRKLCRNVKQKELKTRTTLDKRR